MSGCKMSAIKRLASTRLTSTKGVLRSIKLHLTPLVNLNSKQQHLA